MELKEKRYWVNEIFLQVREAGPHDGKILLFLHGFPEHWVAWRKQIPFFASKGYHVVVPDQRGYNESSKPTGIKPYRMQNLVRDVAELIGQLGGTKGGTNRPRLGRGSELGCGRKMSFTQYLFPLVP